MGMDTNWQNRVVLTGMYVRAIKLRYPDVDGISVLAREVNGPGYELLEIPESDTMNPCEYVGYKPQPETVRMLFKLLMGVL